MMITMTDSETLASFMTWRYDDDLDMTFYGTGAFTLESHLAVIGIMLTTDSPEAAIASLYDFEGRYAGVTDTVVRENLYEAVGIMRGAVAS